MTLGKDVAGIALESVGRRAEGTIWGVWVLF